MKIAFFGDGCLGLTERIRDGVTVDRLGWISELKKLGHEVAYFTHRSKAKDCVNLFSNYKGRQFDCDEWDYPEIAFPELDVLVIESRTRIFEPGGSIFLQYLFLNHYMKTNTKICFWDFDIGNTASIVGTRTTRNGSLDSIYANDPYEWENQAFYDLLQESKSSFIYLLPYEIDDEVRKQFDFTENLHMFTQGVNEDFYASIAFDDAKDFDLIYNGSDFNRREKFKDFYGNWSNKGFKVGITGVWNKKKGSKEFLAQFPNVHYFGYLNMLEVYPTLNRARALIQIGMPLYVKRGNFIQRCIEGAFSNVITLIDAEIKDSKKYYLPSRCISKDAVGPYLDEIDGYSAADYAAAVDEQKEYFLDNGYAWKDKVKRFLEIVK